MATVFKIIVLILMSLSLFIFSFGTVNHPNQLPFCLGIFQLIGASLFRRAINSFRISQSKRFLKLFVILVLVRVLGLMIIVEFYKYHWDILPNDYSSVNLESLNPHKQSLDSNTEILC